MRLLIVGALAAASALSPVAVAVAQSTYELKGDALGMTLGAFKERYYRETISAERKAPFCSDANPLGAGISVDERLRGFLINCKQYFPFEEARNSPRTTLAGVKADMGCPHLSGHSG